MAPSTSNSPHPPNRSSGSAVHVAVGRSTDEGDALLRWVLRRFQWSEVVLVHVHKPSPTIRTLRKMPACRLRGCVVSAYRRQEKRLVKKLLLHYLSLCHRAKVHASILMVEHQNISLGIIGLIESHEIRRLVMGTTLPSCLKVNSSKMLAYTAKNAPPFCEIWFIHKGELVWTRDGADDSGALSGVVTAATVQFASGPQVISGDCGTDCSTTAESGHLNWLQAVLSFSEDHDKKSMETLPIEVHHFPENLTMDSLSSSSSGESTMAEIDLKKEEARTSFPNQSKNDSFRAQSMEAFSKHQILKKLEKEAVEAINELKVFQAGFAYETKHSNRLERVLTTIRKKERELVSQRDEAILELQSILRTFSILCKDVEEAISCQTEVMRELEIIQPTITSLKIESYKIHQEKEQAVRCLECQRSQILEELINFHEFIGFKNDSFQFKEFSLTDLKNATCNFSESFRIGQGSIGSVFKGEILNRSVVIKKLFPCNIRGQLEFQKEVVVLGKLKHRNLVPLVGACSASWCLVYDYMPNGNAQDLFLRRHSRNYPWTWKVRTRIASEISRALLFLHSSVPDKVIHGDLKPQNIFFDSDFSCKISDYGLNRLVQGGSIRCPSFRLSTDAAGPISYRDPEYQRTGHLTPKSDVYSFGIIILQLLTGKPLCGLVSEVRQALLGGTLPTILDKTAGVWPVFVSTRLAELGLRCCESKSCDRPELTITLVRELEQLHSMKEQPAVPPFYLCPILQEIMWDPYIAADGFTYEGKAIRDWLENGRETSPMTNMKLDHLNLVPNHALRLAIQDWLFQQECL